MIKHFKTFFYPAIITFSYNLSKELIIKKVTEVLKKKATLFTSNDMTGKFINRDTFAINTLRFANTYHMTYGSTLVGQIIECKNGVTNIKTKTKPALIFYFMFFVFTVFGLVYFYRFIQTGLTEELFWSLGMLTLGPALCIGFSNLANYTVRERYKMYIDKELQTYCS